MNLTHCVAIVINQTNNPMRRMLRQLEFFFNLPRHCRMIRLRPGLPTVHIHGIYMPAHSDR